MQPLASLRHFLAISLILSSAFLSDPASYGGEETQATVNLSAAEAQIMGKEAKLVKMNGADVITGWRSPNDWLKWGANIPVPGIYNVILEYAYAGKTGSNVEVAVGEQGVQTQVVGTLGEENFASVFLAKVEIKQSGTVPVNLTVVQKHGSVIMNMRAIHLVRTEETTLQEPAQQAVHPATR